MTLEKMLWAATFIIALIVAGAMLYDVYKKYKEYTKFECFMQTTFAILLWVLSVIIIKYAF